MNENIENNEKFNNPRLFYCIFIMFIIVFFAIAFLIYSILQSQGMDSQTALFYGLLSGGIGLILLIIVLIFVDFEKIFSLLYREKYILSPWSILNLIIGLASLGLGIYYSITNANNLDIVWALCFFIIFLCSFIQIDYKYKRYSN